MIEKLPVIPVRGFGLIKVLVRLDEGWGGNIWCLNVNCCSWSIASVDGSFVVEGTNEGLKGGIKASSESVFILLFPDAMLDEAPNWVLWGIDILALEIILKYLF